MQHWCAIILRTLSIQRERTWYAWRKKLTFWKCGSLSGNMYLFDLLLSLTSKESLAVGLLGYQFILLAPSGSQACSLYHRPWLCSVQDFLFRQFKILSLSWLVSMWYNDFGASAYITLLGTCYTGISTPGWRRTAHPGSVPCCFSAP